MRQLYHFFTKPVTFVFNNPLWKTQNNFVRATTVPACRQAGVPSEN